MPDHRSRPEEMLAYWKSLVGDGSLAAWQPENMGMFFQAFRPNGQGVEAAFDGVVGAEQILPRLMQVYEATAAGWEPEGRSDWYFVVRQPTPLAAERAEELCTEHLQKVAQLAKEFEAAGDEDTVAELQALLDPLPRVEVVQGETPQPPDDDDPEGLIYEVTNDVMRYLRWNLKPVESHAHLMDEALYTLACDYSLAYHILWPLYRHLTPVSEPFAAYFELWQHGAGYRFHQSDQVTVYVPNLLT